MHVELKANYGECTALSLLHRTNEQYIKHALDRFCFFRCDVTASETKQKEIRDNIAWKGSPMVSSQRTGQAEGSVVQQLTDSL